MDESFKIQFKHCLIVKIWEKIMGIMVYVGLIIIHQKPYETKK